MIHRKASWIQWSVLLSLVFLLGAFRMTYSGEIARFEQLGTTLKGASAEDLFGCYVSPVGKWNSTDHHFAVSAPGHDSDRGKVKVMRRDTGAGIWVTFSHYIGQSQGDEFGRFIHTIPDISGNGRDEMIVSATKFGFAESGKVYIYEGGTIGSSTTYTTPFKVINAPIIRSLTPKFFGKSVASGDIQGLGNEPDLVISASGSDQVFLFKWSSSQYVRYRTHTGQAGSLYGREVAVVGDIDGDGNDDYVIGAPMWESASTGPVGKVFAYSGDDGSELWSDFGTFKVLDQPGDDDSITSGFGFAVATAGDWNGDDTLDVIVGAWNEKDGGNNTPQGEVYILSGSDGARLDSLFTPDMYGAFGWSVAGGVDFGADGLDDLLIGAPGAQEFGGVKTFGHAFVFAGNSITDTLFSEWGTLEDDQNLTFPLDPFDVPNELEAGFGIGTDVQFTGDLDGDGLMDIAVAGAYLDPDGDDFKGILKIFRSFYLGDVNATETVNDSDVVALENYVFDATALDQLVAADFDEDGDVDQDDICALNDHVGSSWFTLGDVNNSGSITIADVTYLISFLTGDPAGPRPDPWLSGDVNLDCVIDSVDITCLIDYIFNSGPLPCP